MLERITIPASFLGERGVVIVREPVGVDLGGVIDRLRACDYGRPFVVDDGVVRRLHFSPLYTQSEMVIASPNALTLAYTQKMMGFLLFAPAPRHVLLLGLGGGSLTKYCYHHLPYARITTVEIDPDVIAFADLFALPPLSTRHSVVEGDAADYLARTTDRADVIVVDGCDGQGIAPAFGEASFFTNLRAVLGPDGVLVMNLVGPVEGRCVSLGNIARAFSRDRMIIQAVSDGNQVVFAFKNAGYVPPWRQIEEHAAWLARRHAVDFCLLARKLRRSYERRAELLR